MADVRINALATTATSAASDDYLALDGSANGTRKILATNVAQNVTDVTFGTSGPSAKSSIAARAARQGLVFDGTNSATVSVPAFGTSAWTVSFWVNLNSLRNYDGLFGGASGAFTGYTDASGNLAIGKSGVGSITVSSYFPSALKTYLVTITNDGTTATIYRDGVSITTSTSANIIANYTAGIVAFGSNNNANANPLAGSLSGALVYNRALSAAEVVSLYEAGVPSGADYNSASNTAINTSAVVNSANTAFDYDTFTGASATGFTAGVTSSVNGSFASVNGAAYSVVTGTRYLATFNATLTSGTAPRLSFGSSVLSNLVSNVHIVTAGSNSVIFTITATASRDLYFHNLAGESANYTISGLSVTRLGLLLAPDAAQAGGGLTWYDTSGNAANITLPASGVTWNVPSSRVLGGNWTVDGGRLTLNNATESYVELKVGGTTKGYVDQLSSVLNILGMSGVDVDIYAGGNNPANRVAKFAASGIATTLYGNLTVSGTGTSSVAGDLSVGASSSNVYSGRFTGAGGTTFVAIGGGANPTLNGYTANFASTTSLSLQNQGGNVLVGTTTDSANGKLQLATHTTSAGGIGFGTDTSLFRVTAGYLYLDSTATALYGFSIGGVRKAYAQWINATGSFEIGAEAAGSQTKIFSSGTTALTLDSSQNATFAGKLYSVSGTATTPAFSFTGDTGTGMYRSSAGIGALAASGSTAAFWANNVFAIYSGVPLRLGNAYTAGAPTATGYVTIQDSAGNTYKVLVGT